MEKTPPFWHLQNVSKRGSLMFPQRGREPHLSD
jgi:hypothetical protein